MLRLQIPVTVPDFPARAGHWAAPSAFTAKRVPTRNSWISWGYFDTDVLTGSAESLLNSQAATIVVLRKGETTPI